MFVTAVKIDEIDGYNVHGYPRGGTGEHGNDYIKVKKKGTLGKFLFNSERWEDKCYLDAAAKKKIEKYLKDNKETLRQKIKDLK